MTHRAAGVFVSASQRGRRGAPTRRPSETILGARLELDFTIFRVTEQPSLRLYLYTPAADGPTEAKLR